MASIGRRRCNLVARFLNSLCRSPGLVCIAMVSALASTPGMSTLAGEPPNDSIRRGLAALSIERGYLASLHLNGQSLAAAMKRLQVDGFSCGIALADATFDVPARVMCEKSNANLAQPCEFLSVSLFGEWKGTSRRVLLARMSETSVSRVRAFCPNVPSFEGDVEDPTAAANYLTNIGVGKLSAQDVYDRLLADGFKCAANWQSADTSPTYLCVAQNTRACERLEVTISALAPRARHDTSDGPSPDAEDNGNRTAAPVSARCRLTRTTKGLPT